ncbi:MAG: TlpA family protein disulfide reductase [Ferruginibacter sp.]
MKKIVFSLMAVCFVSGAFAQVDTTQQYFKSPFIPAFNIRKVPDSSSFTNAMLEKKKPVILIFFDPDCDHCQEATKKLTAKMDLLKNAQVLMVTVMDFKRTQKFYIDYKIADYPNITVTRDAGFDLPRFYRVGSIPDIYVYNKNGKFLNHYMHTIPVDEIAALF